MSDEVVTLCQLFAGDDANTEIGTPTKIVDHTSIGDISEKLQAKRNYNQQLSSGVSMNAVK